MAQQNLRGTQRPTDTPEDKVQFGPSMPIVDGQVQVPSWGSVVKNNLIPHSSYELPPVKRVDLGLKPEGPKGELVAEGNLWPDEMIHPLFPEFQELSGVDKMSSISHYAHASRKTGKLGRLGEFGLTENPQIIVDPIGMRWPFEVNAQKAAARPREKNMHGRGAWGEIELVPNPDPSKRYDFGVLSKGGVGDMRLSLGAEQDTNVIGGALGIPLSPNEQGVESANFLMLSGPGSQLDDLDFFAKPLSTVALPNDSTPTKFIILDHAFKAAAESGVRPANHMFRYDQDGNFNPDAEIPAQIDLVPNPKLSLHNLASLESQSVDGVGGAAVREKFSNLKLEDRGQPVQVLDLALSEALVAASPGLTEGAAVTLKVQNRDGTDLPFAAKVSERNGETAKLRFENPPADAQMAIYQSMDLLYEIGRRIQPGDHLYTINLKTESGEWKKDVARVMARGDFFPSEFADHQRLYGHTERPDSTPRLRKILSGIRWATGNIGEALSLLKFW